MDTGKDCQNLTYWTATLSVSPGGRYVVPSQCIFWKK